MAIKGEALVPPDQPNALEQEEPRFIHNLRVRGGPDPHTVEVYLDGRPLHGVVRLGLAADATKPTRVLLELHAEMNLDLDVENLQTLEVDPHGEPG